MTVKIKQLNPAYLKSEKLFSDFLSNNIKNEVNYTDYEYEVESIEPFPIYINQSDDDIRFNKMLESFTIMKRLYISLDQDVLMSHNFWLSLFLNHFTDYLFIEYPKLRSSKNAFEQILLKQFDWENYIFKMVLITQYICDNIPEIEQPKMIKAFSDNMDILNYCLKYRLFRNDIFIINIIKVIQNNGLSKILKKKMVQIEGYGKDERYGRRVILELNKRYPVSLIHVFEFEEFEVTFLQILDELVGTQTLQN